MSDLFGAPAEKKEISTGYLADVLRRLTEFFAKFGAWVILPLASFIILIDVGLRYLFNSPLIWGLEFTRVMLIFIFMMAIPETTRRHGHIRMALLFSRFSTIGRNLVTVLYSLIASGVFILFGIREFDEFIFAISRGRETEYLSIPLWTLNAAKLISCFLLVLFFDMRIVGVIIGRDPFPEPERETAMWED